MRMNYVNFCKNYFTISNIPVNLLKKDQPIYSAVGERLSLKPSKNYLVFWEIVPDVSNPGFCSYSPDIEYGWIHIEGTDYHIVLGPAFNIPVSDELVRQYMHENAIPASYREAVAEFLCTIPTLSHQQFANHLSHIHMSLNRKEIELSSLFRQDELKIQSLGQQHTEKISENMENNNLHNTYPIEQQLWECIKNGNVQKLESFLVSLPSRLMEGKLANTPLRHAKNLFIITTVKAGIMGAIPGGVDVEKTYQLIDLYIQECEKQQSIEAVKNLQYAMLTDFCKRAGETHVPEGISLSVYQCMNYIRSHTNDPITIEDVAMQIHRSPAYTARCFKKELGINMGVFIMRCKLEEAKSLLTYTNKSLAEISSYLCFSNQSYFQNVFKKQYGITPLQYRKKNQRV